MVSKLDSITPKETSILIVDDSYQYSDVLKRVLKGVFGYNNIVTSASTGEAYELITKDPEKFRLMFVDYNFPDGTNGSEFLNRLHQTGLMQERVAFLITSEPTLDNMKAATDAGALGVVAKPFDRSELKNQLEKAELSIVTDNKESF